jgi:hypothetical protein
MAEYARKDTALASLAKIGRYSEASDTCRFFNTRLVRPVVGDSYLQSGPPMRNKVCTIFFCTLREAEALSAMPTRHLMYTTRRSSRLSRMWHSYASLPSS